MGSAWRHALAILVLPVTVTVIVPAWIARRTSLAVDLPSTLTEWALAGLGLGVFIVGAILFLTCLARFIGDGKGTLAPWDPPTQLVVKGPYAHVRNPMISGVVLILFAEGLLLRSLPHLIWAGAFVLFNAIYIPLLEEPSLRARFGDEYEKYTNHVPRLIPRITPWRGA
jgi:protein-S-isoprenylcysteine O-methyltransferase Ste14